MSQSRVWYRKGGLASWDYRFKYDPRSLNDLKIRKQWIIDVTQSLFSILKPFATPGNAEVGTFSQGDEAFLVQHDDPKYLEKLLQFLRSTDDVTDVTISLDLHCYEIDEQLQVKKLSLGNAGFLWLYINLDETGQIYNHWENYDPVTLMLSIDVNIYAPLLNETEQSLETARMNAPILKGFLKRLEKELPFELTDQDGPWYMLEYLEKM